MAVASPDSVVADLLDFIGRSPSPFHAVASVRARLDAAGFDLCDPSDAWQPGRNYVANGGVIVAWDDRDADATTPFRIVGAHTDSPNLRIKPRPDVTSAGYRQLGVEVYGGVLRNSWLDRDLGLSGRVVVGSAGGELQTRLLLTDRPLLRVPQLAIHLDRTINDKGLQLNDQEHMAPIWGLVPTDPSADAKPAGTGTEEPDEYSFVHFLAGELGVDAAAVIAYDVMTHDLTPGAVFGRNGEFYAVGRIDNLASVHGATEALAAASTTKTDTTTGRGVVPVVAFFDHEEVGSNSATGAASPALMNVLERSVLARGGSREALLQALAGSHAVSADGAHATHPNYADRHEPNHHIHLNGGPVLKTNANQRYATDAQTQAPVVDAAQQAGIELQHFVTRTDLPCGSTIGPATATAAGISVVDLGLPQLSMHSAREMAGTQDSAQLIALLTTYLQA